MSMSAYLRSELIKMAAQPTIEAYGAVTSTHHTSSMSR